VAFAYMRIVVKVDFGGRDGLCLVALAVSSLLAMTAGALVGTTPGVKTGIFSAISCVLSIFTGLYGSASQRLADNVAASFPVLSHLNPLWQIAHSFFCLLYYDSLEPFAQSCGALLAMAAALMAVAVLRMRRQRYEHL
jgi:ABC-2 type transport system permease protein